MDLSQTIAQLEKQAAQYTDAANALRALTPGASPAAVVEAATAAPAARRPGRPAQSAAKPAASKAKKVVGQKRYVSPETRAKIAAAIKERHAEKKRALEAS